MKPAAFLPVALRSRGLHLTCVCAPSCGLVSRHGAEGCGGWHRPVSCSAASAVSDAELSQGRLVVCCCLCSRGVKAA